STRAPCPLPGPAHRYRYRRKRSPPCPRHRPPRRAAAAPSRASPAPGPPALAAEPDPPGTGPESRIAWQCLLDGTPDAAESHLARRSPHDTEGTAKTREILSSACPRCLSCGSVSRQDVAHHVALDIGQAEVATAVAVRQLRVVQPHQVQDGGVQVA